MVKADLINQLANKMGISKEESKEIVKSFFQILKETLESGREIEIRNFGCFRFREREPHHGWNFQKGELITVPARVEIVFVPSKHLRINRKGPKLGHA